MYVIILFKGSIKQIDMNPSILANPAPSNGLNTVLGNIPASAPPSAGALAVLTPSVHNSVKEPMINPVASYPVIARPYRNGWEQMFHAGDLIFVNTDKKNQQSFGSYHKRFPQLCLANLPLLNYFLRNENNVDESLQDIRNWKFLGVMRNDMQMDGDALYTSNASKKNQKAIRLLNVDVRGCSRVFNYWQTAQAGSTLYLAGVDVDMRNVNGNSGVANLDSARDAHMRYKREIAALENAQPRNDAAIDAYKQKHVRYQVFPFADTAATDKDVGLFDMDKAPNHENDESFLQRSVYATGGSGFQVCVGWCFQYLGPAERSLHNSAVYHATQFFDDRFKLPTIPIFTRT